MEDKNKQPKGFTLIELLIVITIISILTAVIFVAVDPATRFADARNAVRRQEVNSILESLLKYQIDHRGSLPNTIDAVTASSQVLGTGLACDSGCTPAGTTVANCLDLSTYLVDEYLADIPVDSLDGTTVMTNYYVNKTANNRVRVGSCSAENSATIFAQR